MKHTQRIMAALVLLLLTLPMILPLTGGAVVENQIQAKTDIEILGGTQLHGGGHITWIITGKEATTLRQKILEHFDYNRDGRLQSYEVRSPSGNGYLNAVERYVEEERIRDVRNNTLSPYWDVNIGGSAPLHVNNQDLTVDVQGLVGTTNETQENIYIYYYYDCNTNLGRTIINMDDDRMVQALYYPFGETYSNTTTVSNTVYMVGLSSYSSPSRPDQFIMLRNPSGEIIWYSQTYGGSEAGSRSHSTIMFSDFNFLENAQILFVVALIGAYVSVSMPNKEFFQYRKKFPRKMRSRARKIKWLHNLSKVFVLLILLFYFVPTMGPVFFSGIMIWIISISFAVVSTLLSKSAYGRAEVPEPPAPRQVPKQATQPIPPPPKDHVSAAPPKKAQPRPKPKAKPKKAPKKEKRPASKPDAPAPVAATAVEEEKVCGICLRPITSAMDSVKCQSCGREYHLTCAKKEVFCPSCNQKIIAPKKVSIQCFSCGEIFEIEEGEDLLFVTCPACGVVQKKLETGLNYLILGTHPRVAFSMLKTLVNLGAQGLILSTTYPSKLKKTYGLNDMEIRWFTDTTAEEGTIDPKRLEFEATRTISNFIKDMETAVILIDGLEYLVVENGFDNVLRFIKKINDISSVNGATLIMSVNPKSMSQDELTVLMKDFDVIEDLTRDRKHTA